MPLLDIEYKLLDAAKSGDVAQMETLVAQNPTLNLNIQDDRKDYSWSDPSLKTPLHHAAINGQINTVKYLVEQGANKEAADNDGRTPLWWAAAFYGKIDIVKYLVEQGANKEAADKYGRTPLWQAAANGRIDTVKYLVEQGANKEAADEYGRTPLWLAAANGRIDTVRSSR